jgi:hypothetical protein
MKKVTRNVADIEPVDRHALEHLLGQLLSESQQVTISVAPLTDAGAEEYSPPVRPAVPAWWNIYEGLNDEEIEKLDQAIRQRANLTRSSE